MARILVTGGTGYIGSHTTVELMQQGYDVTIVDNLSNSSIDVLDGIAAIVGKKPDFANIDCGNFMDLDHVFKQFPDIVKYSGISTRVGTRGPADRGLIDIDDLVKIFGTAYFLMLSGRGMGAVQCMGKRLIQDLVHQ